MGREVWPLGLLRARVLFLEGIIAPCRPIAAGAIRRRGGEQTINGCVNETFVVGTANVNETFVFGTANSVNVNETSIF